MRYSGIQLETARYARIQLGTDTDTVRYSGLQDTVDLLEHGHGYTYTDTGIQRDT